jgi:DNA polymerase III delta subunit
VRNKSGQSAFSTPIQYRFEIPSQFNETYEEEIKWIQIRKEEDKLSLFANDVILFLRGTKNCTKKNLAEIINSFGKVAVYKINIQQLSVYKKGTD